MSLMGRDFIIWYTGSYFPNIHHNLRSQTLPCEDNQSWPKFYKETFHPSYLDCVPLTGDQTLPIWPATKLLIESSSKMKKSLLKSAFTEMKELELLSTFKSKNVLIRSSAHYWSRLEVDNLCFTLSTSCEQVVTRGAVQFIKGGGTSQYFRFQHRSFQFNL